MILIIRPYLITLFLSLAAGLLVKAQPTQQQLLNSGWREYEKGNLSEAKKINDDCIRISRLAKDYKTEAKCLINNGTIAYVEGDFKNSFSFYDTSYQLYSLIADTVQSVHALRNMALASRRLSQYGQGINFCNQALNLLRFSKEKQLKAQVLNTLSTLFESTNNLEYAKKSLRHAIQLTAEKDRSHQYVNLGNIYFKTEKIDSAIFFYQTALPLAEDTIQFARILNNLGESFILTDSTAQAYRALTQSLAIRKTKDSLSLIYTYNNLAQLFLHQNKLREADHHLSLVAEELEKIPNEREALKFFLLRRIYFTNTGQFQKALKFDVLYDSLNSKIFEESRIKVAELQTAYELNERDQQLALQKQTVRLQLAELDQKNFQNRLITIGGIIALAFAVWLFYLYKVNSRLRYKNEALAREQNHRVKNNLQMIASLLSVQSSSHSDETIKTVLTQNENRIQSVALLHRMLYENELSSAVSMQQYVDDLTTELKEALGARNVVFQLGVKIDQLSIEKTISIGLILNELITNSVKYASYSEELEIGISLIRKESHAVLHYSDNGRNFEPIAFLESNSFGSRLIALQAKQLKGKYNITNKGGFNFVLSFPIL